ncbi:MAG: hypothetical protein AAFV07_09645 [Bacteroidota bacterium]
MPSIHTYAIRFHGGLKGEGTGIRAHIHLFDSQNKMVGRIDFYDPKLTLPADRNDGMIHMSMSADQIHAVVDVLRNEKPIYLQWQKTLQNAYLGTGQEPVGEGE